MFHLVFGISLLIIAFITAQLEIQIEGQHGMASALPTWRKENKWTKIFFGGRPFTGYHLYSFLSLVAITHLVPFLVVLMSGLTWSFRLEALIASFIILTIILEDFLWFVFNPHYGLKKFKKEYIWWHRKWFLGLPLDYWIWFPIALTIYLFATGLIF